MLFSHKVAVCTSVALLVSLMVPSGGAAAGSGPAVDAHGPQAGFARRHHVVARSGTATPTVSQATPIDELKKALPAWQDKFAKAQSEGGDVPSLMHFAREEMEKSKRGWNPFGGSDHSSSSSSAKPTMVSSSGASSSASPSSSASSGGGGSQTRTGQATFYKPDTGACGKENSDSDMIAAVSHSLFDSQGNAKEPNSNPVCGKKIKATYQGKSVTASVMDRCTGCSYNDLDFSPAVFTKLASKDAGRLKGVKWSFIDDGDDSSSDSGSSSSSSS